MVSEDKSLSEKKDRRTVEGGGVGVVDVGAGVDAGVVDTVESIKVSVGLVAKHESPEASKYRKNRIERHIISSREASFGPVGDEPEKCPFLSTFFSYKWFLVRLPSPLSNKKKTSKGRPSSSSTTQERRNDLAVG